METSRLVRSVALASFLGTALVGGATLDAALPEEAEAGYEIDESYFYVSLSSYGSWVQNAQFGWVWYPNQRSRAWRPYTVGRWVWTDYGEWMWASDEPYGWATYHYGRWFLDPFYGWVWLPGRVWAPAWVSWRDGGDYIGWAPLSPWGYWDNDRHCYRDRYHHGHYNGHYDGDYDDGNHHNGRPDGGHGDHHDGDGHGGRGDYDRERRYHDNQDTWNFTRKRDFASARVDKVVIDRQHIPEVYKKSRDLPPPSVEDERQGRGTTRAIERATIERAAGRPIRPIRVEDADAPSVAGKRDNSPDRVRVYRPKVGERKPDAPTPDKLGIAKQPDRAGRPSSARGAATEPVDRSTRDGNPARAEPSRHDRMDQKAPARGDAATREPRSPVRGRGASGAPEKATRPAKPTTSPANDEPSRGGAGGGQRLGKPDTGAYERPAREDERGGYERPARPTDPLGYVRPDSRKGGSDPASPARSSEPRGQGGSTKQSSQAQQPSRVPQPTYGRQPSRVPQPTYGRQPSQSQQPSRSSQPPSDGRPSQQPSRMQQPLQGGSGSSPSRPSAPQPSTSSSSYQRPSSPSGSGHGGGGSQGRAPFSPSQGSYPQGQGSRGGGSSHGGGASSLGGRSGGSPSGQH